MRNIFLFVIACIFLVFVSFGSSITESPAWSYKCEKNACLKVRLINIDEAVSLPVCRMFCGFEIGTVWPKPTGIFRMSDKLAHINPNSINFKSEELEADAFIYFSETQARFLKILKQKLPIDAKIYNNHAQIDIKLHINHNNLFLTYETDESYKLKIKFNNGTVEVSIESENYYGLRHALETLAQLIVYDDIHEKLMIAADLELEDAPVYKHRGFMLDTSRSYFSIKSIKRTIDALALVKMNTFHWHITDSHSFPIVLNSMPELAKLGAYSSRQVYTEDQIKDLVRYAKVRGVRIIPEFDTPAHVGEGWQDLGLTSCFNAQPWKKYCFEPPCGQLDPTKDELYDVLEKLYADFVEYFSLETAFHMGGDEVSAECWNSTTSIQEWMQEHGRGLDRIDYINLWGEFQEKALERWNRVAKTEVPIILWTSHLTGPPFLDKYLNNQRYIIQVWTKKDDPQIPKLLEKGFRIIVSNSDALYLDCGFSGWVKDGNNWCSPYIGWQKIYSNDLKIIGGDNVAQILGAEAPLWSEQADEHTLDARLWPRLSALAERLWTDPVGSWRDAESRMLYHRENLVQHGIMAELLEPQWCLQNDNQCPLVVS